jgi:hypothetical protein
VLNKNWHRRYSREIINRTPFEHGCAAVTLPRFIGEGNIKTLAQRFSLGKTEPPFRALFQKRITLPASAKMTDWLDENCGGGGWARHRQGRVEGYRSILPIRRRRRVCSAVVHRVPDAGGERVFQVRDDDPAPRVGTALHRTP